MAAADELRPYLDPTRFIDSDHRDAIAEARRLTRGCASETTRSGPARGHSR